MTLHFKYLSPVKHCYMKSLIRYAKSMVMILTLWVTKSVGNTWFSCAKATLFR